MRESRERVRAAILNSGFEFPAKRITANLAPAYLRKVGPGFDLALAWPSWPPAARCRPARWRAGRSFGELSLGGELRPAPRHAGGGRGRASRRHGRLAAPRERAAEAALVPGIEVAGVETLQEAVEVAARRAGAAAGARARAGATPRRRRRGPT